MGSGLVIGYLLRKMFLEHTRIAISGSCSASIERINMRRTRCVRRALRVLLASFFSGSLGTRVGVVTGLHPGQKRRRSRS